MDVDRPSVIMPLVDTEQDSICMQYIMSLYIDAINFHICEVDLPFFITDNSMYNHLEYYYYYSCVIPDLDVLFVCFKAPYSFGASSSAVHPISVMFQFDLRPINIMTHEIHVKLLTNKSCREDI